MQLLPIGPVNKSGNNIHKAGTHSNTHDKSVQQSFRTHTGATLPLNKFVAHAGVSSRRAAATLVKEGKVTVNGVVVTDPGTKVLYTDTVKVAGQESDCFQSFRLYPAE